MAGHPQVLELLKEMLDSGKTPERWNGNMAAGEGPLGNGPPPRSASTGWSAGAARASMATSAGRRSATRTRRHSGSATSASALPEFPSGSPGGRRSQVQPGRTSGFGRHGVDAG